MPKYGAGFGRGRILERCQKLGYCPFQRFSEPSFSNTAQGPQLKHVDTPGSGYEFTEIKESEAAEDRFAVSRRMSVKAGGFANSCSCENEPQLRQTLTSFGQVNAHIIDLKKPPSLYVDPSEKVTVNCSKYEECEEVREMTEEQVLELRQRMQLVKVVDLADTNIKNYRSIPKPIWKFEHAFVSNEGLMELISSMGFDKPTPIQCQMWPILLSGHDCIGIAQTGTGKTLAFLLPAFLHMDAQNVRCSPAVLILTPTRELACQIEKEANKFSYNSYKIVCLYGGANRYAQIVKCRNGMDIAIATPGRLNDLIGDKAVNLQGVSYLVLDEADRMLDMGFRPQIEKIVDMTCKSRVTVLTSATWPENVRALARQYTKSAMQVVVGSLSLKACENVKQDVRVASRINEKMDHLLGEISNMPEKSAMLLFANRKCDVDTIQARLMQQSVPCAAMHGGRDQFEREEALNALRKGEIKVLVATDIASRGIDLPNITHVFNFDFPTSMEEYVHRIGRTGRAGKSGSSVTLIARWEDYRAPELIEILDKNSQNVPAELRHLAERFEQKVVARGSVSEEARVIGLRGLPEAEFENEEEDFYLQKGSSRTEKITKSSPYLCCPFSRKDMSKISV